MSVAALEIGGRTIDAARLEDICTRYGIAELAVFGSVARGDATPTSDVDVLYMLRPDASLGFAIDDLEDELADLFGRRVDLVARKAVHPMLRPTIEEQARIVYAA
jgi:predicted nucleotidyltransferase